MENEVKTPKIVSNVITESTLENSTYWIGEGNFGEIQELKRKIYELEDKTIRLEKTFKFSCFYTAIIYVVFLIIGHWANWI